jgi:hypothetical protein
VTVESRGFWLGGLQIGDIQKAVIAERIGKADKLILDGGSESLQLLDVAALMMRQVNKDSSEAMVM